jgi:glutamyl-tRNA reductase
MKIIACGVNHKTAKLELREKMAVSHDQYAAKLKELLSCGSIKEAVLLSTCNRSALYCVGNSILEVKKLFLKLFAKEEGVDETLLTCFEGRKAVEHLMRVACGLDSLVLGENQILGQLKSAYAEACLESAVGLQLSRLFQNVFSMAKRVRASTSIGACPMSIASTAIKLLENSNPSLKSATVLLLGAGEVNKLVARHLVEHDVKKIWVMSRRYSSSVDLAKSIDAEPVELKKLMALLPTVEVVISATTSTVPVISLPMLEKTNKTRGSQYPQIFVDLAVPRDVDPRVGSLPHVLLYTVDDLKQVMCDSTDGRKHAAEQAEAMIQTHAQDFLLWLQSLTAVPTICAYRESLESLQKEELERALKLLRKGESPESVLYELSRNMINKFMHGPTVQLRQAGYEGRADVLLAAKELFDLG